MKVIKILLENFIVVIAFLMLTIKDVVLRIMGYVRLEEIHIPSYYIRPRKEKLDRKKEIYKKYRTLPQIMIDENNVLVDGFCTYFLAAVWNWEYIKVKHVKSKKNVRRKKYRY